MFEGDVINTASERVRIPIVCLHSFSRWKATKLSIISLAMYQIVGQTYLFCLGCQSVEEKDNCELKTACTSGVYSPRHSWNVSTKPYLSLKRGSCYLSASCTCYYFRSHQQTWLWFYRGGGAVPDAVYISSPAKFVIQVSERMENS